MRPLPPVQRRYGGMFIARQNPVCDHLREHWTTDLKDRRIRVNAVSPGSIDTPGLSDLLASSEVGEQRKKMIFQYCSARQIRYSR